MRTLVLACLAVGVAIAANSPAQAAGRRIQSRTIIEQPWHGGYANTQWGRPVALVVPPTAKYETTWGWGVGHSEMYPVEHQFGRSDPGVMGGSFAPTPVWPSHTQQFGTYYLRGPR